eukprot:GHVN01030104.1.p1 GENE.GHVN01030104.1~~GHVN01030104.1.p1  ORF type:complete len:549 (-),score=184.20 GHVN01030104.1:769-2415(-)
MPSHPKVVEVEVEFTSSSGLRQDRQLRSQTERGGESISPRRVRRHRPSGLYSPHSPHPVGGGDDRCERDESKLIDSLSLSTSRQTLAVALVPVHSRQAHLLNDDEGEGIPVHTDTYSEDESGVYGYYGDGGETFDETTSLNTTHYGSGYRRQRSDDTSHSPESRQRSDETPHSPESRRKLGEVDEMDGWADGCEPSMSEVTATSLDDRYGSSDTLPWLWKDEVNMEVRRGEMRRGVVGRMDANVIKTRRPPLRGRCRSLAPSHLSHPNGEVRPRERSVVREMSEVVKGRASKMIGGRREAESTRGKPKRATQRSKPEWDNNMTDMTRYRLSPSSRLRKKIQAVSRNHYSAALGYRIHRFTDSNELMKEYKALPPINPPRNLLDIQEQDRPHLYRQTRVRTPSPHCNDVSDSRRFARVRDSKHSSHSPMSHREVSDVAKRGASPQPKNRHTEALVQSSFQRSINQRQSPHLPLSPRSRHATHSPRTRARPHTDPTLSHDLGGTVTPQWGVGTETAPSDTTSFTDHPLKSVAIYPLTTLKTHQVTNLTHH